MWSKLLNVFISFLIGFNFVSAQTTASQDIFEKIDQLIITSKNLYESTPDSALRFANQALALASQYELDSIKGRIHIAISVSYSYMAEYNEAIKNSFDALKYAQKYSDTTVIIDAYNNLGIDYMYDGNNEASAKYFGQVEKVSRLFGDSLRLGHALNNLGLIANENGNYEQELEYYEKAQTIFEAISEEEGFANTLLNIGTVYTLLGNYNKATTYYQQSLSSFKALDYASAIEQTLQSMSENYLAQGKATQALETANEALVVAKKNRITQDLPYIYDLIHQIYAQQKRYNLAYEYLSLQRAISDSIFTQEKSQQINELNTRYEAQQKQQQIKLLTIQNQLNEVALAKKKREQFMLIFIILLLVIVAGFVFYITSIRAKLKKELLSQEIDNLRLKINSLVDGNASHLDINMDVLNKSLINPLTEREFEIFNSAISDNNNNEIAEQLFVSVNTVKYHLKNIYEKLGVSNRKEALQFALNSGSNSDK